MSHSRRARSSYGAIWASISAVLTVAACGTEVDTVAYGSFSKAAGGAAFGGHSGVSAGSGGVAGDDEPHAGAGGHAGDAGGGPAVGCVDGYPHLAWTSPSGVTRSRCVAGFARDRMNYAICSRGALDTSGRVYTDAIDSESGSSASGSAAVGVNGEYLGQLSPIISGGFTVASKNLLLLPGLDVHGDLRLRGSLRTSGPIHVARDAWFAESVVSLTSARVERDVHLAPGKTLEGFLSEDVGGRVLREAFEFPLPCGGSSDALDFASVIGNAAAENENSMIGLESRALLAPAQAAEWSLPCGRFYVTAIGGSRDIRLQVTGRSALFVAGDVATSGKLDIDLAPGAELDWFVGGNLALGNIGVLGSPSAPAALRIYVAGSGQISLPRELIYGNLYAPNADVALTGIGDFHGSISAARVTSLTDIIVHYDAAVQHASDACAEEVPSDCSGCAECPAGQTCLQDSCVPCSSDADCCSPLVCNEGRCSAFNE